MPTITKPSQPGARLQRIRMRLGLTTRKVAELSRSVAIERQDEEFAISHGRLSQIENEGSVPSIFKLFTLSTIYGISLSDLLTAYLELGAAGQLHVSMQHACTHPYSVDGVRKPHIVPKPMRVGSSGLSETGPIPAAADEWGSVSASVLDDFSGRRCRYAFIGLSDRTMYPLIRPGSFVQIEDCQKTAHSGEYQTEFDRPIYFIETHVGYICSWCEVGGGYLISIPHPLSPCRARQFAFPREAEIIGQVTAVAARLTPFEVPETARRQNRLAPEERQSGSSVAGGTGGGENGR
jgi:transcriptional regulator with XRE-family HTH domain